jgi:hypothetical protein
MNAVGWRPRFFEENDLFAPIRDLALRFAGDATFPSPERIDEVLRDRVPIRFLRATQQDKRLYDDRIVNDGAVSTRDGSWHDFLNALVWATFPLAKSALHRRQHGIVVPGAPKRTPEGDALAMLDEGGVFLLPRRVVFGHAIFESLVLGRPLYGAGIDLGTEDDIDRRAAEHIADRSLIRTTKDLIRIDF